MSYLVLTEEQLDRLFQRASYWITQRRPPLLDWSKYDIRMRGITLGATWITVAPPDSSRVYLGFGAIAGAASVVSTNAGGLSGGGVIVPSSGELVEFHRERHGPLVGSQWYGQDTTAIPTANGLTVIEVMYYPNRR